MELSADGLLVADGEGNILYANPAAEALLSRRPGTLHQGRLSIALPLDGVHEIEVGREDNPEGSGVVEITAAPIRWQGAAAYLLTVFDATERRRTEAALRESEARQRALLNAIPDLMFILSAEGTPLDCRVPGHGWPTQLGKRRMESFLPPDLAEQTRSQIAAALETGKVQSFAYDLTMWGRQHHFEARLAPAGSGQVLALVRDVTTETELQRKTQHTQKMEALGQLAGSVAHDFNNLLMAMMGTAELCRRKVPQHHEARSHLDSLLEQVEQAADLTRGLLGFARRQPLKRHPMDVGVFLRRMIPILRRLIPENIEVECVYCPEQAVAQADQTQLQQVLLNLCVNARDAMPFGGTITLTVDTTELDEGFVALHPYAQTGPYVRLAVHDTGQGMDAETRSRIFEPFFTTKGPTQGTGIGLATVYGIVKQHKGFIEVSSEPGAGSLFEVYLPLLEPEIESMELPVVDTLDLGGTERVLVAEDDEQVRRLLARSLENLGYTVHQVGNGLEALEILRQEPVDLVITDSVMPQMGGTELFAAARELYPELPFLFSSGYGEETLGDAVAAATRVEVIAKPYSINSLAAKLRILLGGDPDQETPADDAP